jgi:hypothetical protein
MPFITPVERGGARRDDLSVSVDYMSLAQSKALNYCALVMRLRQA